MSLFHKKKDAKNIIWRLTYTGGIFIFLLIVLFFLAVHTSNNLIFLIFSFLLSIAIVSAITNYFSLERVECYGVDIENSFANQNIPFRIIINKSKYVD